MSVLRRRKGQAGPGLRPLARHLPGSVGEGTARPPGSCRLLTGQRLRGLRLLSHGSGRVRGARRNLARRNDRLLTGHVR
ncbi:hypothetical protein KUG12_22390, partial [Streptomyces sp. BV333]|nr:hypothetical protein [Streptomyces sp. BV333]